MRFILLLFFFQLGPSGIYAQEEKSGVPDYFSQKILILSSEERAEIVNLYATRNFEPIWLTDGIPNPQAIALREIISQVHYDGLNPKDYGLSKIDFLLANLQVRNSPSGPGLKEEFEGFMTASFYRLIDHLLYGKVNPTQLSGIWAINKIRDPHEVIYWLEKSIGDPYLNLTLNQVRPKNPMYRKGRRWMMDLEKELDSNPEDFRELSLNKNLKLGDKSAEISAILKRLAEMGFYDLHSQDSSLTQYDSSAWTAVKKLQREFGLEDDGIIGKQTMAALNTNPKSKMKQIAVNLERMRWIPDEAWQGQRILVNIPEFEMTFFDGIDSLFSSEVIVGTVQNQTPIFTAQMSYLVFSPYWNVPESITRNEIIPAVKRNRNYLDRNKMEVVTSAGRIINPTLVDWSKRPFPYQIRQKPGPHNSLGLVKFMFPNPHQVYIHDTPAKQLFFKSYRAFSHGCIRMRKPQEFSAFLLRDDSSWTTDKIREAMSRERELEVRLTKPIPVWVLYFTVGMGAQGQPDFKNDVYGLDEEVWELLQK
ncbi:L,D-transpeptidase family protein [Algoriphagus hitonicola]|uniref:Murein L,D-transpeptidase YcbB/YkuD n=1 Tax=Algoriphagus hitonicola TaxID=435880 RepID=A0A1I2P5L8_9BACT|nr:L,D-transpeptidase family protein [Algoriphagus hitonicola]SFG11455.1 Murein L,D-transpeptidase YcbB/YkuD [Algoriphagus hitonicola]